MAFCAKCGVQITDGAAFCGSCGAPAVPASTVSSASPASPMASNVAGLVAYLLGFITGIVLLVVEPYKNDKFVRFHAFQSIFISGVYLAVMVAWGIFTSALIGISFGALWSVAILGWWIVRLAFFGLWLFLLYRAYNNDRFELPVIGAIARRLAG